MEVVVCHSDVTPSHRHTWVRAKQRARVEGLKKLKKKKKKSKEDAENAADGESGGGGTEDGKSKKR